jgi:putative transposase
MCEALLDGADRARHVRMSRPLRIQQAGLTYHVMARGNGKMKLFRESADYQKLLWLFADTCQRYRVDCFLYCLMPNHYHFGIRTREPNLSRAVHHVNAAFAQWWNRSHDHVGHVFQARFKAQVVESGRYVLNLTRYLMRNPLRAGLVDDLAAWPWSSYHATIGRDTAPSFLDTDVALHVIGDGPRPARQNRFREFVSLQESDDDDEMQALVRGDVRVIGSQAYRERFDALATSASREVPRLERNLAKPSIEIYLKQQVGRLPLSEAIREAQAMGHHATAIATCLGISLRSVRRLAAAAKARAGTVESKWSEGAPRTIEPLAET